MSILLPGQPLPLPSSSAGPQPRAGPGTFTRAGQIVASTVGTAVRDGGVVSVKGKAAASPIPDIDSVVLATVVRLTSKQATLSIDVINGQPCRGDEGFQGIIRAQDVRSTEKDKVKLQHAMRPGDIVRAVVISLGDARSYYLATARNDLGVVFATSESGNTLQPISWQAMRDPKTGMVELRKCAKPEGV